MQNNHIEYRKKVVTKLIKFATAYLCESVFSAVLFTKRGKNGTKKREGQKVYPSKQRKCDLRNYARTNKCKIPCDKWLQI